MAQLITGAVMLQTLESLWLERRLGAIDPWATPWFPRGAFVAVLWLRLASVLVAAFMAAPVAYALMWASTYAIALRYRGTFNGGSDAMTFHILGAVTLMAFFPQWAGPATLYVAVLATLSYFVAGLSKLNSRAWRKGVALPKFLGRPLFSSPFLTAVVSVAVIVFECLFPLALLNPQAAEFFLAIGVIFHLGNVYFFGLNRFFFAWLAAYPAIYITAQYPILK